MRIVAAGDAILRRPSNGEFAGRLRVSEAMVKAQVSRVLGKLGVRDRVQAAVLAHENGIVRPGG